MKDLGTFRKQPPIFQLTTTDIVIVSMLIGFAFIVCGGMANEHYSKDALQTQEMFDASRP